MAATTYNFPCWQTIDDIWKASVDSEYPIGDRDDAGLGFSTTTHGLTTEFTTAFAVLMRSWDDAPWSHTRDNDYDKTAYDDNHLIWSIATQNQGWTDFFFAVQNSEASAADRFIALYSAEGTGPTIRWNYKLGDENGASWCSLNKWYQVVVSVTSAGAVDWAVNGSLTPTSTEVNAPTGTSVATLASKRIWMYGPYAAVNYSGLDATLSGPWPSIVAGPLMIHNTALDLTDSATLARFYDANGDFRNPGENGSLWLSGTYSTAPTIFLPNGCPTFDKGSQSATWASIFNALGANSGGIHAGLRKDHESPVSDASLLTDLVSWWTLDEASGNRADSHGSYTLTDGNTVLPAQTGYSRVRNAADFQPSNSEYLYGASNGTAYTPSGSFTIAVWLNPDDIAGAGSSTTAMSVEGSASQISWRLVATSSSTQSEGVAGFDFSVSGDGSSVTTVGNTSGLTNDEWYLVICEYDSANSLIKISINNGTPNTAAFTGPVFTAAAPLVIGAKYGAGSGSNFYNGQADEAAFWTRLLTNAEKGLLYNARGGRGYPG